MYENKKLSENKNIIKKKLYKNKINIKKHKNK